MLRLASWDFTLVGALPDDEKDPRGIDVVASDEGVVGYVLILPGGNPRRRSAL